LSAVSSARPQFQKRARFRSACRGAGWRRRGRCGSDRLARVDGDIADPETAKAAVETALARFGSIDALVDNAGIFFTKAFIDYTIEDYRRLAATNLEGFLHLTQRVVRQMLAQKALISDDWLTRREVATTL
jgi:NAD(P)-dependent dehydrogenase (short-subunit alcohol dehydrogenase family)